MGRICQVHVAVDHGVGIIVRVKPGDEVRVGDPVLELHYRTRATLDAALRLASLALTVGEAAPAAARLIVAEVR